LAEPYYLPSVSARQSRRPEILRRVRSSSRRPLSSVRSVKRCWAEVLWRLRRAAACPYTPKHLAQKILTSRSALEGERKQVTVLFCDVVGSTSLAERLGADAMHGFLNRFFDVALAEVHRYEGTINQFLGDGFMASSAGESSRRPRRAPAQRRTSTSSRRGSPQRRYSGTRMMATALTTSRYAQMIPAPP